MLTLPDNVRTSPALARAVPYVVLLVLTSAQGWFGEPGRYWLYLVKCVVGAWMLWDLRKVLPEMRVAFTWEAVVVGVLVCVMWVGLDPYYPQQDALWHKLGFGKDPAENPVKPWNPFVQFGEGSLMAWFFVLVRIAGSTLVVPPMEELFYRSLVYRYLISPEFERIPLNFRHTIALAITCIIFGFIHAQWLAGILCGLAYHWLVFRRNRIADAIVAHGITNLLLGLWVVWRGAWQFW